MADADPPPPGEVAKAPGGDVPVTGATATAPTTTTPTTTQPSTSVPAQAPTTATTAPGPRTSLSSPPTTVEEGIAEWFLRRKMKQPLPPGHYPDAGDDESNIKTVDSGRRAFADTPWNRDPRTEQLMKEKRIEELISNILCAVMKTIKTVLIHKIYLFCPIFAAHYFTTFSLVFVRRHQYNRKIVTSEKGFYQCSYRDC